MNGLATGGLPSLHHSPVRSEPGGMVRPRGNQRGLPKIGVGNVRAAPSPQEVRHFLKTRPKYRYFYIIRPMGEGERNPKVTKS